jgi:hypothetical protein
MNTPNQFTSLEAALRFLFQAEGQWRGASEFIR